MKRQPKGLAFFYRTGNKKAAEWEKKLTSWLQKKYPRVKIGKKDPELVVILGGDGTILEAARKYMSSSPLLFGLNLGQVGFLAAVRKEENFLIGLKKLMRGNYLAVEKMMIQATVKRNGNVIFKTHALNDVLIENPLGMLKMEVSIGDYPFQYIEGTGALIATATGSTAYNLSAHGPIVMPNIKCLILTEVLDHNIPTPSIVVKYDQKIALKISSFRERGFLTLKKTRQRAEVILVCDGEMIFPLEKNDSIIIQASPRLVKFAEIEKNYFLKSLQGKFAFH